MPRLRWGHGALAGALLAALLAYNLSVALPARAAIQAAGGTGGATLVVHRDWLLSPDGLAIDVVAMSDAVAPVDLFRGLLHAGAALKDRRFKRVVLARHGAAIYVMDGTAFQSMGEQFAAGGNPLALIRIIPETLRNPDGSPAFGRWEGGWLGVLGKQLEDANRFARGWATGQTPPPEIEALP